MKGKKRNTVEKERKKGWMNERKMTERTKERVNEWMKEREIERKEL